MQSVSRSLSSTNHRLILFGLILLAISIVTIPVLARAGDSPQAEVQAAWQRAAQAGSYHFVTELSQTTAPAQNVANIGQQAQAEQYHIEGDRLTGEADLEMTFWSNGGSALDFSQGVSIRVQGDKAYARNGESAWQEINNFTGLFAPNNDPLGYLSAADDVVWVGEVEALSETLQHYRYTIDNARFATYMSDQLKAQAHQKYALPSSLSFDLTEAYQGMEGRGEIWLDANGFPRRHVVDLNLPSEDTAQLLAHADMSFTGFAVTGAADTTMLATLQRGASAAAEGSARIALPLGLTLLFLTLVLRWGSRRKVQAVLAVVVCASIVFTPLLESAQVHAFAEDIRAEKKAAEARSEETEMEKTLRNLDTNRQLPSGALQIIENDPGTDTDGDGITDVYEAFLETNPFSEPETGKTTDAALLAERGISLSALNAEDLTDDDGDGLPDVQEKLLGTATWADDADNDGRLDGYDTDGDGISDLDEVKGFSFNNQTWYTDPLEMDTNRDGIGDGLEWNSVERGHPTWDLDGDLQPDLFDMDNDNDGVPDRYDLSPSKAGTASFSKENPLALALDGVQPNWVTFYDLQIRPTRDDYLRYAFNVLDWPTDQKGQMQDWDNATYASTDPSLPANPNANGDMKLIPMLELQVSAGSSGLPLTDTPPAFNAMLQDRTGSGVRGMLRFSQNRNDVEVVLSNQVLPEGKPHYNLSNFLYTGTCSNLGKKIGEQVYFSSRQPYTARFTGQQLASLVDGNHALVSYSESYMGMEHTNPYAEWSCADIARLPQENGKFIDTPYLSAYGITVNYASAAGEDKIIYAPLNLVTAEGSANVAFQTRLVLRPGDGGITSPMRASMVWVVQALMDSCSSSDLTTCSYLNSPQALHTYRSDFRVTGAAVREDHGAETAVIFEDVGQRVFNMYPGGLLNRDDNLFVLAQALNQTFLAGRDCDTTDANGKCVGNGEPDMTLREIERRFDGRYYHAPVPTQEERLGLPAGVINVLRTEHASIDEARKSTLEHVQDYVRAALRKLDPDVGRTADPTLLFATTENYRSANAETLPNLGDSGKLTLNLTGASLITANDMSWKTYSRESGSDTWVTKPLDVQWQALETQYLDQTAPDQEEHLGGVVFLRMFYTALYQGMSSIVKIDGKVLTSSAMQSDKAMYTLYVKYAFKASGPVVKFVVEQVLAQMMRGIHFPITLSRVLKGLSALAVSQVKPVVNAFREMVKWFRADTWGLKRIGAYAGIGVVVLLAMTAAVYAVTALLAKYAFNASWGTAAMSVVTMGVSVAFSLGMPLFSIAKAIYGIYKAGSSLLSATATVLGGASSIIGSTVVGALVGLAINIATAWGVFFYQWAAGAIQPGTIAFNVALAGVLAQVVVSVLIFVLSVCVIGTILVAIVSAIDAILQMLCSGFRVQSACFTLTGTLSNFLTEFFYGITLTIDTSRNDLVVPSSMNVELANPEMGYVVGNRLRVVAGIDSFFKQQMEQQPTQQRAFMLANNRDFYTDQWLKSSAMNFAIDAMPAIPDRNTQVAQFNDVKLLGPFYERYENRDFEYYLNQGYLHNTVTSPWYNMTSTGLNKSFPSKLNLSYAFPGVECKAGFCQDYTFSGQKEGADLGLVYDILPPTFDEFLNFSGWAGNSFPRQADPDFDGAHYSVDPDETRWDTDGDGLSDGYEQTLRASGVNALLDSTDSDGDGLSDWMEVIYETNAGSADTDGDGLTDLTEINGWTFTYAPGQTTLARSNPKRADSDGDTLSDLLEYNLHRQHPAAYAYHPRATNLSPVELDILSVNGMYIVSGGTIHIQAPVRFDEQYGSNTTLTGTVTVTLSENLAAYPSDQVKEFPITLGAGGQTVVEVKVAATTSGVSGIASVRLDGEIRQGETLLGSVSQAVSTPLVLDNTPPMAAITSFTDGAIFRAGSTVVVGGTARDSNSGVAGVKLLLSRDSEVPSFNGQAEGADTWAYSLNVPDAEGSYSLCPVARNNVGLETDMESGYYACTSFMVDGTPAEVTHKTADNTLTRAVKNAQNRWTLPVEVTAAAEAQQVEARITPFGSGWMPMSQGEEENRWVIAYPLTGEDSDGALLGDPNAVFTVQVRAYDPLGNVHSDATAPTINLRVDNDAPEHTLIAPEPGRVETSAIGLVTIPSPVTEIKRDNRVITGTVQETGAVQSGIQGLDVRLLSAEDGMAPGMWKLWYRNNNLPDGNPDAVAETRDIEFDWGEASPAEGIFADGFAADFQRPSLFFTSGIYEFTIAHTGASSSLYDDDYKSGTVLTIDGQQVARLDGSKDSGTFTAQVSAGVHNVRLVYFHKSGAAAVSMRVKTVGSDWSAASLDAHDPAAQSVVWQYQLPDLEGIYQIDLRGADSLDNRNEWSETWQVWQGEVDTAAPRLNLTTEYVGAGMNAFTRYTVSVTDFNLDESTLVSPCAVEADDRYYYETTWWKEHFPNVQRLQSISSACSVPGHQPESVELKACDKNGLCSQSSFTPADVPNRRSLFWTETNAGVSSVQRLNLIDQHVDEHLKAGNGEAWQDISSNKTTGALYLADSAVNGRITRLDANAAPVHVWIDGSADPANDPNRVVAAGGKLFWLNQATGRLWIANADGSAPYGAPTGGLKTFDVDAGAGVIVATTAGEYDLDKILFLDLQGNTIGSMTPHFQLPSWLEIRELSLDPLGKAIYLSANFDQAHWWGITRVPYPASFRQHIDQVSNGVKIVNQHASDLLVDPEAQKVYYSTVEYIYDYTIHQLQPVWSVMRVNPDGSDPERLATRPDDSNPTGLALLPNEAIAVHDAVVTMRANDGSAGVTLSALDANTLPLTYELVSAPIHGSVTGIPTLPQVAAPTLRYLYQGAGDVEDQFTLRVTNGRGSEATIQVHVSVLPSLQVDAQILEPRDGQIINSDGPIHVRIGLMADAGARTAGLTANAQSVASKDFPTPYPTLTVWEFDWTPPKEGRYYLTPTLLDADLRADSDGSYNQIKIYVDRAASTASIDPVVTARPGTDGRFLTFTGTAADASGVQRVQVRFEGGPWQDARFDATAGTWSANHNLAQSPDNLAIHVDVRVTDSAGNVTESSADRTLDFTLPGEVQVNYAAAGTPLTLPAVLRQNSADVSMAWTASSDGSGIKGYWAGWTASATPDKSLLTFYPAETLNHTQALGNSVAWAHLGIEANNGDIRWQTSAALVVDDALTPDIIAAPDMTGGVARAWIDSGSTRLARQYAPVNGDEHLFYTTWNSTHLAFAWKGHRLTYENAFLYLDTGKTGGARTAYNPFNDGVTVNLPADGRPFEADYAVWGKPDGSALLLRWNGANWEEAGVVSNAMIEYNLWAAWVSFSDLGITNPDNNPLDLVAILTGANAMELRAAFPPYNPINSSLKSESLRDLKTLTLQQQYHWDALPGGVAPNAGKAFASQVKAFLWPRDEAVSGSYFSDAQFSLQNPAAAWIDADRDGVPDDTARLTSPQKLPADNVVEYTLYVRNEALEPATSLTARLELGGALALADGQSDVIPLGDFAPGEQRTFTFSLRTLPEAGPSGEVRVVLVSPALGDFEWLWAMHRVDIQPPSVTVAAPAAYLPGGSTTFTGTASDDTGISVIQAKIDGVNVWSCLPADTTFSTTTWSCTWEVPGSTGTHTLEVRARDLTGTYSAWTQITLPVDSLPPSVTLDVLDQEVFRDRVLLSGAINDGAPNLVYVCSDEALQTCDQAVPGSDGNWQLEQTLSGEEDYHTVRFYLAGDDKAGNRSGVMYSAYTMDRKAPLLTAVQVETSVPHLSASYAQPVLLTGTLTDGDGLAWVEVGVDGPDGTKVTRVVPYAGAWSYRQAFGAPGAYTLTVSGLDRAGNRSEAEPFTLTVRPTADLSVQLSASPNPVTANPAVISYSVTAKNSSAIESPDTQVRLDLPAGAQVQSSTPCEMNAVDGRFTWNIGALGANAETACTVVVQIANPRSGPISASTGISGEYEDLLPGNNAASLEITAQVNYPPNVGLRQTQNGVYRVEEGGTVTLDASTSWDPDGDSLSYAWDLDNDGQYDDASGVQTTFNAAGRDGPVNVSVGLRVTDAPGASTDVTVPIQVTNAAPVVNVGADVSTVQGRPETFTATITDGFADPLTYQWSVRRVPGESSVIASTPGASYTFSQYGWSQVCLRVSDDDGGQAEDCLAVWVGNAPAVVEAGSNQTIDEGQAVTLTGSFTDDSGAEVHSYRWMYGDGIGEEGALAAGEPLPAIPHTYDQDGVYTVTLQVWDAYNGPVSDTLTITVNNLLPQVDAGEDVIINEGEEAAFAGTATEAGPFDALTTNWDFGDGSTGSSSLSGSHRYVQSGAFTATLSASDDDATVTDTRTITVNNLPPRFKTRRVEGQDVKQVNFAVAADHQTVTLTGAAEDPGVLDNITLNIDWDDDSPAEDVTVGQGGSFNAEHVYANQTPRTVTLTLTDSDGGQLVQTYDLTLNSTPVTTCIEDDEFEDRQDAPKDLQLQCSFSDADGQTGDSYTLLWEVINTDTGEAVTSSETHVYDEDYTVQDLYKSHHFALGGNYTIRLTVTDSYGSRSSDDYHIYIPTRVLLDFGGDRTINEGTTINFQGTLDGASTYAAGDYTLAWSRYCVGSADENYENFIDDPADPDDQYHVPIVRTFAFEDNCLIDWDPETQQERRWPYNLELLAIRTSDKEHYYGLGKVMVNNVAPALENLSTNLPIARGMTLTLTADLVEPGVQDGVNVQVDWGDSGQHTEHIAAPAAGPVAWSHLYPNAGDYTVTITLTDKDGDFTTETLPVHVPESLLAARAGADAAAAEGESVPFQGSYENLRSGGTYTYQWDFGDGTATVSQAVTSHTYAQDGVYTATLTVSDGTDTVTDTRIVRVSNARPALGGAALDHLVEGAEAVLTLTAGDPGSRDTLALTVNWGDGVEKTYPNVRGALEYRHTYANNGSYTVTLRLSDGEGGVDQASLPAAVSNAAPSAGITLTGSGPYRLGDKLTFTGVYSDPGEQDTLTYRWQMGDGAQYTTPNVDHVYTSLGAMTVTFTVTDPDGGATTAKQTLTVISPQPMVEAGADRGGLEGQSITFKAQASANTALTWEWGDGTKSEFAIGQPGGLTPSHTYTASGAYTVELTATTGDGIHSSDSLTVTVSNAAPELGEVTSNSPILSSQTLTLTAVLSDPGGDPLTLTVDWQDGKVETFSYSAGTTGAQVTHAYGASTSGSLTLALTLSDGKGGSASRSLPITINRPVVGLVLSGPAAPVKEGQAATFSAAATNPIAGDPTNLTWDFGDGIIQKGGASLSHTYAAAGSYTVTVTAAGQLSQAVQRTRVVTVENAAPTLASTAITPTLEGGQAVLTLTAADDSPNPDLTLSIDWGDESPAEVVTGARGSLRYTHRYADNGSYPVALTLSDQHGAEAAASLTAVVNNAAPVAAIQGGSLFTAGQSAAFTAKASDPGEQDTITYLWKMGDGTQYTTGSVDHTYTAFGEYTVTLTVTDKDGDANTVTQEVTVQSAPVNVVVGVDKATINEGQSVTFSATINGMTDTTGLTLEWDFGDGTRITGLTGDQALTRAHTYADNGVYTATLTVTSTDGVASLGAQTVSVSNVAPTLGEVSSSVELPRGGMLTLEVPVADAGLEDTLALTIDWGDGVTERKSYAANAGTVKMNHTYAAPLVGNLTAGLTLNDGDDEVSKQVPVTILPVSLSAELGAELGGKEGAPVRFSAQVTSPLSADTVTLTWDFGDGSTATYKLGQADALTPAHTYAEDGAYQVTLSATGLWSQPASDGLTVTVTDEDPRLENATFTNLAGEGMLMTFRAGVADPGAYDRVSLSLDWGDGCPAETLSNVRGVFTRSHRYPDNGDYTLTVRLVSDGRTVENAFAIKIENVAPVVQLNLPEYVKIGQAFHVAGDAQDPGSAEALQYHWDMGDGAIYDTLEITHTYATNGTYPVTLTVTDKDGASGQATAQVQAVDRVILVDAGANQTVQEGQRLTFAGTLDGGSTFEGYTLRWDFGDGATAEGTLAPTHTYTSEGSYSVSLTVSNPGGDTFVDRLTVTVFNAPPALGQVPPEAVQTRGRQVTFDLPLQDPGDDPLTLEIDWGDGGPVERVNVPAGARQVTLSHTYARSVPRGLLLLHLRLEDDEGAVTEQDMELDYQPFVTLYLPVIQR